MGTISIRKVSSIPTPLSGRVNLAVKTDDILYIKDENGNEFPVGADGLGGTNYIFVKGNGTDIENAAELQAAYNEAVALAPTTIEESVTILVSPGLYNFESTEFEIDTDYINVVALSSNDNLEYGSGYGQWVKFNSTDPNGTIFVNSSRNVIKGIDVDTKNFKVGDGVSPLIINCVGGDYSFGGVLFGDPPLNISGTFINCQGGNFSFGGNGEANGVFINCRGGDESFGYDLASGFFKDCEGGDFSFAFAGIMSGKFENCTSGIASFGTFGLIPNGAESLRCTSGDFSFGNSAIIGDALFLECISGDESFGFDYSLINEGKYLRCTLTTGTFDIPTLGGHVLLGIDGNFVVQNITGI